MIDLNDLRVFERVATLRSFAAASRELKVPRSSVSRSIQRLEATVGVRLLQRTTRDVTLTEAGVALLDQSAESLARLGDALDYVSGLGEEPRGTLRISAGIGFGVNILSELLPEFIRRHPNVDATLDLSSTPADLVAERIDVAIRMGPMPDSQIVAKRLGLLHRYLCASPDYLSRRGTPAVIDDLRRHDLVDLPVRDGRKSTWVFVKDQERVEHRQAARLSVNCALTVHKMLLNGGGIGLSTAYLCAPELEVGRLTRLLPEWSIPAVVVHAVFPTQRQLAPAVRAFVQFMIEHPKAGAYWQHDALQ
ncbi:LysR family transcriptional regulator [Methylobacterium sp. sgz302541]|uniref:LysR family transcriptional regulator n=1 Tax=unclassified Methylobacterium TaxID=2615210 RepID=UPI003D341713